LETGPGDGGSAWARAGPAESPVDALGRLGAVVSASRPFSARRERGATPGSPREGAAEGSRARPFPVSVARGRRCTSGRTTERPPRRGVPRHRVHRPPMPVAGPRGRWTRRRYGPSRGRPRDRVRGPPRPAPPTPAPASLPAAGRGGTAAGPQPEITRSFA